MTYSPCQYSLPYWIPPSQDTRIGVSGPSKAGGTVGYEKGKAACGFMPEAAVNWELNGTLV